MTRPPEPAVAPRSAIEMGLFKTSVKVSVVKVGGLIFGLLSFILIAHRFGASAETDALFLARMIPLLIATQLGRALSVSIVPILSKSLDAGDAGQSARTAGVLCISLLVFLLFFVLGYYLSAKYVMNLVGAGLDDEARMLATRLTELLSVAMFFMGGFAVLEALMNAHRSFLTPEALFTLYPLGTCFGALVLAGPFGITGIPLGTITGTAVMFLAALVLVSSRYELSFDSPLTQGFALLGRVWRQAIAVLWGGAAGQVSFVVARGLAAALGPGQVSILTYAYRICASVPVFWAMSLGKVLLPHLSVEAELESLDDFKRSVVRFVRLMLFIFVPFAALIFILREPIIVMIFGHGAFTVSNVAQTADVVAYFAPGLVFGAVNMVMMRAFFSLEEARVIYRTGALFLVVSVALSLVLIGPMGLRGLALANSLAMLVQTVALIVMLQARVGRFVTRRLAGYTLKVVCGAAAAAFLVRLGLSVWADSYDQIGALLVLLAAGVCYLALYFGALRGWGVSETVALARAMRARLL